MKRTRMISVILIISILISMAVIPDVRVHAEDESKKYYEQGFYPIFYSSSNDGIFQSIKNDLPSGTPPTITVNGSVYPFNYRIWFAKNIVVYGDYSTVNPRANDFKAESDSPYGVGYYSKNGVRGEYRYHGFDKSGNRYSNTWFTIDEITTSSINDNKWLYRPWDDPNKQVEPSDYNEAAERYETPEDINTREWINRPIEKDGEILTFENAEDPNEREAYRYIHIMSPPTINYLGEGKGWYLYNNFIYYRTFTLDKLDHVDKLMTPVETKVTVETPEWKLIVNDYGDKNPAEYLDGEVEVEVRVEGILKEEEYYNDPVKKIARYTRHDIRDWTISLNSQSGTETQDNVQSSSYNVGSATFTLKFKRSQIFQQSEYELSGSTTVNFLNDKTNQNSEKTMLKFKVNKISDPGGAKEIPDVETKVKILTPEDKLTIYDYGSANTFEYLVSQVEVDVLVEGTLKDEAYYNVPSLKEKYYTRDDIAYWNVALEARGNNI